MVLANCNWWYVSYISPQCMLLNQTRKNYCITLVNPTFPWIKQGFLSPLHGPVKSLNIHPMFYHLLLLPENYQNCPTASFRLGGYSLGSTGLHSPLSQLAELIINILINFAYQASNKSKQRYVDQRGLLSRLTAVCSELLYKSPEMQKWDSVHSNSNSSSESALIRRLAGFLSVRTYTGWV